MTAAQKRNPAGGPGFEMAQTMVNGPQAQRTTAVVGVHP